MKKQQTINFNKDTLNLLKINSINQDRSISYIVNEMVAYFLEHQLEGLNIFKAIDSLFDNIEHLSEESDASEIREACKDLKRLERYSAIDKKTARAYKSSILNYATMSGNLDVYNKEL